MDEPREDPFVFGFPLYAVYRVGVKPLTLVTVHGPAGEVAFPLFTDEDLATRFRDGHPEFAGQRVYAVPSVAGLGKVLAMLERKGFTHVILDHPGPGAAVGRGHPRFPLPEFRRRAGLGREGDPAPETD